MLEVFRFECRYQLRSPLFLSIALVWFLLAFFVMASESVQIGGIADNLNLNASHSIISAHYVLSIIGMFAAVAFVASAITRDQEAGTDELLYATGVSESAYLFGRFSGGTLFATLAVLAGVAGSLVGSFMPWLDPERVGDFSLAPYVFAAFAVVLPNMFVICGLFFAVAALTRSMMAAYLTALGFLILFVVVAANTNPESISTLALGGPFGQVAFEELTRYWTVAERNYQVPAFTGTLLYNRLIWAGLALLALLLTRLLYRFRLGGKGAGRRDSKSLSPPQLRAFNAEPEHSPQVVWRQLLSLTRIDISGIVKSAPFYVLLAFGMFNVTGGFLAAMESTFGTPVYPVTEVVSRAVGSNFSFVVLLILLYYAGELVHRERQLRVDQIIDATPFPSGAAVAAKVLALWFVITALFVTVILAGVLLQALHGYTNFAPAIYLTDVLGVIGGSFYFWAIIAVFVQSVSPGKYVGMLILMLIFIGTEVLANFGLEHVLYSLSLPNAPFSAMNGYGHFLEPLLTVAAYLAGLGVLVFIGTHLLYPRGLQSISERVSHAGVRFTAPVRQAAVLAFVATLALGGWIFHNTVVVNEYRTNDDLELQRAEYERSYRKYLEVPLPSVATLNVEIHLVPEERRLESLGRIRLVNETEQEIAELPLSIPPHLNINSLQVAGARQTFADEVLGFYIYTFEEPMQPGTQAEAQWDLTWSHSGFENSNSSTRLVHNGTFVNNSEIMPAPGYDRDRELQDNNVRRQHDLEPLIRMNKLEDRSRRVSSIFGRRRTKFEAIVSTAPDQTAVAPGYLAAQWQEDGRAFFKYVMDKPIWPFVSVLSARYKQVKDTWVNPDGGDDVELAVLFDEQHSYNVQRMLEGSKKSLDYFHREFSAYQYRQFRILEFPGYQRFAQSFPNTIPYSERIGFISDLRDPADIDFVFYVTAHELAHQWWGHQVTGADVQGQSMIIETLAQYSALMVMEREYGAPKMRRFLKYELDSYLSSRGTELIEELPLLRVEDQGYIHYRKGSLAMYALKEAIGEAKVNAALRRFLAVYAFNENDYPTSADLINEFRAQAGPEHSELISDLFEKITLFDLSVAEVSVVEIEGEFEVTAQVRASKYYADGKGNETEVPLNAELELAVFPKPSPAQQKTMNNSDLPPPLMLTKRTLSSGEQTFVFRVQDEPARVGIDPYNKMIDRNPDDNLRWVN